MQLTRGLGLQKLCVKQMNAMQMTRGHRLHAPVMSGFRWVGSSWGQGRKMILELDEGMSSRT